MSKDYRRQGLLRIVVSLGNGALTVKAPTDKAVLNEIATLDIAIAKILCRSEADALGLRTLAHRCAMRHEGQAENQYGYQR